MISRNNTGFTLLEVLMAVAIFGLITMVIAGALAAVSISWRKGTQLSDQLGHADYVIEQLVMGLRSAYYPDVPNPTGYGFTMDDNGIGEGASDSMSWVKIGGAMVGADCPFSGSPHRIQFFCDPAKKTGGAMIRAWRLQDQTEDFDPEQDVIPTPLSDRIRGFNVRCFDKYEDSGEIEWLDEWKETNRLPRKVEITLYLEPATEGDDPVEIKRIVEIPVAPLSWR
jgi:prepilin-type N-terminal cleavage/methylation domain-containing protein